MRAVFIGALSASFAESVRTHLPIACEFVATDEANAPSELADADVVVSLVFTGAMGAAAKRLRLIQVPGAGLDRIDRAAVPGGASISSVYGHENGIAEYVFGAMLVLNRNFNRLDAKLRTGEWESQWAVGPPPPVWPELAGKTLGILGYGRIGQAIARRARAFDMAICAVRQNVMQSSGEDVALLGGPELTDEVVRRADYLVITLPLTDATRGLMDRSRIGLMKPGAFLVNVARAGITDEDALYEALAQRRIAGAALDVWYRYPTDGQPTLPSRRPFHELSNVLMTPHVSGWTDGMLDTRARLIAENIQRVSQGLPPLNLVS